MHFKCKGGRDLATEADFGAQRGVAQDVLAWYAQYSYMLRRLRSGALNTVVHGMVGGGGSAEGTRRMGGCSIGIDTVDMPSYRRRFGEGTFVQGDALDRAVLGDLFRKHRPVGAMYSPPCKPYSAANLDKGVPKDKALIEQTRDVLNEVGCLYAIENVLGAAGRMSKASTLLRGEWFGLKVDRARLFETNFDVHVDEALKRPGELLRARTCLGRRRRFRRLDPFGRPVQTDCCGGNLFALQGTKPLYCTVEECAEAMGVDVGHMPYEELAQAIPPDYAALIFGQMCMRRAEQEFGAPAITYDDMLRSPAESRRKLALWLRGAGAPSPSIGLTLTKVRRSLAGDSVEAEEGGAASAEPKAASPGGGTASQGEPVSPLGSFLPEVEFRELYYTRSGGYDRVVSDEGGARWMDQLRPDAISYSLDALAPRALAGRNTLVYLRD